MSAGGARHGSPEGLSHRPHADGQAEPLRPFEAHVTRVLDGDTIEVQATNTIRVRLEGIDCPEDGQPFSRAARNFTRQLIFDKRVTVRPVTTDRYGRLVARVLVDGRDVSVEIVKAGLAWHYTDYSSDPALAGAEKRARAARAGVWSEPHPVPPWVARRPAPKAERTARVPDSGPHAGPVRGNTASRVFHRPGCPSYTCRNCTAVFRDAASAVAAGFRPAGDCATRSP